MSDFDPDAFLSEVLPEPQAQPPVEAAGFDPDSFLEDMKQEQYGGLGQQIKAGIEGVGRGLAGPLMPMAERAIGVKPEDMLGREEANPITAGAGEVAGLGAGMLTGTGEAALMGKASEGAAALAGLNKVAEGASLGARVGSAAVRQAAEMAVLQGSDEVSKMLMQDPAAGAESAIANVGLAAVIGAGGGAFTAGVLSPLWNTTVGPKLDKALNGLSSHLNGTGKLVAPEAVELAQKELGIEISPATRAAMSGDPKAAQLYNELREAQHPKIKADIDNLHNMSSQKVMDSLKLGAEDVQAYFENEAGHDLKNTFLKEYKQKYGPVSDALEKRDATAINIAVSDEARLHKYGQILEQGMNRFGTDSPYYNLYEEYGNRLLAKDTIGAMDKLKTEVYGRAKGLANDDNTKQALQHIGSMIKDFQEHQIESLANRGLTPGAMTKTGADLLAERTAANAGFGEFRDMSDRLSKHLGVGDFRGYKTLVEKLSEKRSAESLLNAFSPKGDADLIPFLQKNFPETLEKVRENELKKILKPAILSAKGENPVNVKKLNDIIDKHMAGQKEYIDFVMPKGSMEKIKAANTLTDALPAMKSSGTAGWMSKLYKNMPASAMAAVAWLTGHGPLAGYVGGHFAQMLGRDAPDAIKLALLKFMASDQPIKAEGFKSMVEFMHNTYKGETMLAKSVGNILKPGAQVLIDRQIPTPAQLTKLDKMVADNQTRPERLIKDQERGHLGHYLPDHQVATIETSTRALEYLKTLKPQPYQTGPLSRPIEPTPAQENRYQRALMIAQSPAVVLDHVKNGTLKVSDIQDLKSMYPAVYTRMAQKVANELINHVASEDLVPYKTRMGMSLFLGQPLDTSMQPMSILAAQPMPKAPPSQPDQPKRNTSKMGKNVNSYRTPLQASESHKSDRD